MLEIAICEDEQADRERLQGMLYTILDKYKERVEKELEEKRAKKKEEEKLKERVILEKDFKFYFHGGHENDN